MTVVADIEETVGVLKVKFTTVLVLVCVYACVCRPGTTPLSHPQSNVNSVISTDSIGTKFSNRVSVIHQPICWVELYMNLKG